MNLISCKTLTSPQRRQLQDLVESCRRYENVSLSCPLDADRFYLAAPKPEEAPVSLIAVYEVGSVWECSCFTSPKWRRQGYFSALLDLALEDLENEPEKELCLLADQKSPDALKTLAALEAELWYQEHLMSRNLSPCPKAAPGLLSVSFSPLENETLLAAACLTGSQTRAGQCRLLCQGSTACLYEVEILPELRRQGLGTAFLQELFIQLAGRGISRLTLQVSGENEPALRLYKKTGFRIAETLSYYLM